MKSLEARLRDELERHSLPPGARVRTALSGGPDSLALAELLLRHRDRWRPDLVLSVGHVHHGLRGRQADEDQDFCRQYASDRGLPCICVTVDVHAAAREPGVSWETAARDLRLEAFTRWGKNEELAAVATGHTADDQAETVLAHVLRGTGLAGVRGMPTERELPGTTTRLLRPLLAVRRHELLPFLESAGLEPRIDVTNQDLRFRRNRIRQELLPYIREHLNPSVERALLGLAEDASHWVSRAETELAPWTSALRAGPGVAALPREPLCQLPAHLLALLLDRAWSVAAGRTTGLTRDHHRHWQEIIDGAGGDAYDLPGPWQILRAAQWIYVVGPPGEPPVERPVTVGSFEVDASAATLRVGRGLVPTTGIRLRNDWTENATVRGATPKDRIPIRDGHARVFEILRAAGVPRPFRALYPVWCSGGKVVWLPGLRGAPVDPASGGSWGQVVFDADRNAAGFIFDLVSGEVRKKKPGAGLA